LIQQHFAAGTLLAAVHNSAPDKVAVLATQHVALLVNLTAHPLQVAINAAVMRLQPWDVRIVAI
jgi:hypothetical protein